MIGLRTIPAERRRSTTGTLQRIFSASLLAAILSCPVSAVAESAAALATEQVPTHGAIAAPELIPATATDSLHITVGRSVVLTAVTPLRRVYVGNPSVLQTYTSGLTQIVLTAKTAGVSSMVVWDEAGESRLYTVSADIDVQALRASLDEAFPGADIHAEAGEGRMFLTGSVATDAASDAAFKMASQYSKDVVNSLKIIPVHGKQVQLKLRIVEVDRTKLDQQGINIFSGGRTTVNTTTGQFGSALSTAGSMVTASNPMDIFLYNAKLNIGMTIQDLEQRQVLQVLAEPTLTTLSGLPARFLSGGEFPFPVAQAGTGGASTISIQFRPYGVKVDFTPTVNSDGSIRLKLAPEVSTLDYSNAVTISGFTIPALSTRRAETEVEIQDGQSFIVSGLLDHRTTEIMSKVPGIASIPILGQFFRSKNFSHSILELVIIVTAEVVDPLTVNQNEAVKEPRFVVPNLDADTFDVAARREAKQPQPTASDLHPPSRMSQPSDTK